jgi:hypothetical protein
MQYLVGLVSVLALGVMFVGGCADVVTFENEGDLCLDSDPDGTLKVPEAATMTAIP